MAVEVEQSKVSRVIYLSLGSVLTTAITLLSLIIFSRYLSKEDYATYQQTLLIYNLFTPVVTFGAANVLTVFIPGDKENRKFALLLENLLILGFSGFIFSSFLFWGGNEFLASYFNNFRLIEILILFSPIPLFVYPSLLASDCLLVLGKTKTLAIANVFSKGFVGISIITLCLIGCELNGIIEGYAISQILAAVVVIGLTIYFIPKDSFRISFSSMYSMVKLSIPMGLSSMLATISGSMDKFIVATFLPASDFAVYSNGSFEIPLIGIVTGSISLVILPEMRKFIVQNQLHEALKSFRSAAVHSGMIIIPAMFFLWFNAEQVITLAFSNNYAASAVIFKYFLLAMPARIVSFAFFFLALGQTWLVLIRSIISLFLSFALTTILITKFGVKGAAIASLLVVYCWNTFFSLYELSRLISVKISQILPLYSILKIFGLSFASALLMDFSCKFFSVGFSNLVSLLLKFFIFTFFCIILTYYLKIMDFAFFEKAKAKIINNLKS